MSRQKITMFLAAWALVVAVAAMGIPAAAARPILEVDFGSSAPDDAFLHKGKMTGGEAVSVGGRRGWSPTKKHFGVGEPGEFVEYNLNDLGGLPARGSLRFEFARHRSDGNSYSYEGAYSTLASLRDISGRSRLAIYVVWEGRLGQNFPVIHLNSPYDRFTSLWGGRVPFGFPYKEGEAVRLVLTWGTAPEDFRLYVNGQELATRAREGASAEGVQAMIASFQNARPALSTMALGVDVDLSRETPILTEPAFETAVLSFSFDDSVFNGAAQPIRSVSDDTFKVTGISGKLVAGDMVTVTLLASPGGKASFDMGNVKGVPIAEVPATAGGPGIPAVDNGTYRGTYTIQPGDDYEDGYILGHFVSADNVAAEDVASASKWTIDTEPVVTFSIDKKDLPADSATKARVKLVAKDANGNALKGRHFKLTLATTDEYTGTVGAGDFGQNVGASVETRWKGETDSWGEVEFEYKAGFAAKTVILTAKDLDSGGASVDYLTAYKEASIDIALTPVVSRAAGRRGIQYIVKVEASRMELTADGRSRSVIRATVMDPSGTPVPNDPVVFALSSENGSLRTIKGTTDASGVATAEYTAGKRIGIVVVTATASLRNASASVSITLLSDAPAKIYLKARPQSLPADGFSRADLEVKVIDINDNPNADTKVEFRVGKGGGKLDYPARTTDRFGDADNRYVAGTAPGIASIVATVRSKVPTEAELAKAKNVLFVPYNPDSEEIRVEKWLKKKGDAFVKGEALVEYTIGRSSQVHALSLPFDGTMGEQFVEYWDNAEVGQTLCIVLPAAR